jgi:hypothetical protein
MILLLLLMALLRVGLNEADRAADWRCWKNTAARTAYCKNPDLVHFMGKIGGRFADGRAFLPGRNFLWR